MQRLSPILIANRGEIACRVIRTARDLGLRSVAVYSEADAGAPHVKLADQAVGIGPAPSAQSYLDMDRLFAAAKKVGARSIHPGYGFLSENAAFAERCEEEGLIFIGPTAHAIREMGDKARAKALMKKAGVSLLPGWEGSDQSDDTLTAAAEELGYPLLIKAVAGGGGRGMRRVDQSADFADALSSARREAASAFGSDEMMLERLIEHARHVEVQIFADTHGSVLHLFERDCSAQRRRQKVLEEAPSPIVTPELRAKITADAIGAARAVDYRGAGTVEFVVDQQGKHYFLEMNTRLQVEHPVTEQVTGLDLVAWQFIVAAGQPLPLAQDEITCNGWSIEARLCTEDPADGFRPQTGRILAWRPPEGVRLEMGIETGTEISPFYDSMIGKLIATGPDRETARRRLIRSLEEAVLIGPASNAGFLARLLRRDEFANATLDTSMIDGWIEAGDEMLSPAPLTAVEWAAAALLLIDPGAGWFATSGAPTARFDLAHGDECLEVALTPSSEGGFAARIGDEEVSLTVRANDELSAMVTHEGVTRDVPFLREDGAIWLMLDGRSQKFHRRSAAEAQEAESDPTQIVSPMMGTIVHAAKAVGDRIATGDVVAAVEAMKMEIRLLAETSGVIVEMLVQEGDQVREGALIARIDPEEEAE